MAEIGLHVLVVVASVVAAGFAVWGVLDLLATIGRSVFTRRQGWFDRTVKRWTTGAAQPIPRGNVSGAADPPARSLTALVFALGAGTLAAKAALTGSLPIALGLALLGVGGWRYLSARSAHRARRAELTEAVARLVDAFRSTYLIENAVFPALALAAPQIHSPRLAAATERAVEIFRAGRPAPEALAPLGALSDAYLDQFVFILERAPEADAAVVAQSLDDLARRLAERRRIAGRLRVALASVNGTVKFLEAVNLGAGLVAVLLPFWWAYYAAHPLFLATGLVSALAATVYFDLRVQQLEEMTL